MSDERDRLSELPPELRELIVEKCDYLSRCSLSRTCRALKSTVVASKTVIPAVKIKERRNGVHFEFTFRLFKEISLKFERHGQSATRIYRRDKEDVVLEGTDPIAEALSLFHRVCVQKHLTVGYLGIETVGAVPELTEQLRALFTRQSDSDPIKIRKISWQRDGISDLAWTFLEFADKLVLEELIINGEIEEKVNIFGDPQRRAIIQKLDRVEVHPEIEETESELILSLIASRIHLKSQHFTGELIEKMIEKIAKNRKTGSYFILKKTEQSDFLQLVPSGFQKAESIEKNVNAYTMRLKDDDTAISLKMGSFGVYADVQSFKISEERTMMAQLREKCLTRSNCFCQQPTFLPEDDSSEFDDYDEYVDDDSVDYDYERLEMDFNGEFDDFDDDDDDFNEEED
ncbi:unnamed protein product [Caenorhabditis sp. 36 PRJEB53466]|nr:unnamed protein product [Caenorhabditis sp. 36 PRJEB53466]